METKEVKELIEAISNTDYNHIEIKHEGTYLLFQKGKDVRNVESNIEKVSVDNTTSISKEQNKNIAVEDVNLIEIKSPIVGTYYKSSSPESEPYVKVGDKVKKGDVVCIIEAMKLMNEIESEFDGEIVEILIKNEDPVEYGQVLFKMKSI